MLNIPLKTPCTRWSIKEQNSDFHDKKIVDCEDQPKNTKVSNDSHAICCVSSLEN